MENVTDLEPVDFRELRALVVTTRTGSITSAARDLNIGQPELTRSLQRLEAKLGVELFVRHRRGVSLTAAGSLMAEQAEEVLDLMRQTAREINMSGATLRTLIVPPSRQSFTARAGRGERGAAA